MCSNPTESGTNCETEERAGRKGEQEATPESGNVKSKEEQRGDLMSSALTGLIHANREDVNETSEPGCFRKSKHKEKDVHGAGTEGEEVKEERE